MPSVSQNENSAPKPLTAMPAPNVDWSRASGPVSTDYDDVYFSVDDGLAESRAVFLNGCGLPGAWDGRAIYTIGELGFGSGLNFLAVWQLWRAHRPSEHAQLHFVSVEGFPLSREELIRALAPWEELAELSAQLIEKWPDRVYGQHRIECSDGVSLTLCHDDVEAALGNANFSADCWFLDGFSPAKNPQMWAEDILARIFELTADGGRVGTFTVAGAVRRGLAQAGFEVSRREGFGRKRERLEAIKPALSPHRPSQLNAAPIIIGAGIAGASLARSFLRRGITPILIDPDDDSAASGNPAASVKPRFDLQDRPESRFFLSAYLYAVAAYRQTPEAVLHCGAAHSARHDEELARFEKLIAQAPLPPDHLRWADQDFIEDKTGVRPPRSGLWLGGALAIDPKMMTRIWTDGAEPICANVSRLGRDGAMWNIYGGEGQILARSEHVFVAAGANIETLVPDTALDLGYLRGQITWGRAPDNPFKGLMVYGGYAIRRDQDIILGATHDRLERVDPQQARAAGDIENIEGFTQVGGRAITAQAARSSLRVTSAHTRPIAGQIQEGLHVITGLGGRGFCFAPLLAEYLAGQIVGAPCALSNRATSRIMPVVANMTH